jgi:hypothetical protein
VTFTRNRAAFDVSGFCYDQSTGFIYKRGRRRDQPEGAEKRYRCVYSGNHVACAHHLAWRLHYGEWPASTIDHIDGNSHNNAISNLRLATVSENSCYRRKPKHNSTGEKNVHWNKQGNCWRIEIQKAMQVFVWYSHNKMSAILAARLIRRLLHGSFARS